MKNINWKLFTNDFYYYLLEKIKFLEIVNIIYLCANYLNKIRILETLLLCVHKGLS